MDSGTRSYFTLRVCLAILVIIQGSLIFSERQSVNYEDWLKKVTLKPISAVGNGILKTGSTLGQILGSVGVFSISSALQ